MTRPVTPPRLPDWTERLADALAVAADRPFAWGEHDCWLSAADVVLAITGRDPAAAHRGTYADEDGADALVATAGDLGDFAAEHMTAFGAPEFSVPFAQRGDVALVRVGNQDLIGVVADHRVAVTGIDRMQFVPLDLATRCWAV